MNTSISSTSTSSPFITTTVPVTAYNLMLINATILSHLNCNDKGTSILDLRDPKHPQYKCDCYRFYYPLSFYSPCANCLQVYENPKDAEIQCLDICWPKQYTGNDCGNIVCTPGAKSKIGNDSCECKERRVGVYCEMAECGEFGVPNGYGGCTCQLSDPGSPINDLCDPPCYPNHGSWNGNSCNCYDHFIGSDCSLGYCNGRGSWLLSEDRCYCDEKTMFGGRFCEIYIGNSWYKTWYVWVSLLIISFFALGTSIRFYVRAKQRWAQTTVQTINPSNPNGNLSMFPLGAQSWTTASASAPPLPPLPPPEYNSDGVIRSGPNTFRIAVFHNSNGQQWAIVNRPGSDGRVAFQVPPVPQYDQAVRM